MLIHMATVDVSGEIPPRVPGQTHASKANEFFDPAKASIKGVLAN